jgi:hypothetical protein
MKTAQNEAIRGKQPVKRKRGVVLLIVVSLLALFILLGVTYTVVVLQTGHAARLEKEVQRVGDQPETEMDVILGQILYDTQARTSLQHHSLLMDLYGGDQVAGTGDAVRGTVTAIPEFARLPDPMNNPQTVSQVMALYYAPAQGYTFSTITNYYVGRVFTFLGGEPNGLSTRVVGYYPNGLQPNYAGGPVILLEAFDRGTRTQTDPTTWNNGTWSSGTVQFLINGAPFNGAGAGYDATAGQISQTFTPPGLSNSYLVGLLPHFAGYDLSAGPVNPALGGLDETWDAVDLQNMFLAMVPPSSGSNYDIPVIPSFHRPELVNYLVNQFQQQIGGNIDLSNASHKAFLRSFIFRPMPWDHQNFTGSNPNMTAALGPGNLQSSLGIWDVDNDGDQRPDSIWVDVGLPVITTPEGRRIKRLAAILIQDLDGRIDLNAHGNSQQFANQNYRAETQLPGNFGLATPSTFGTIYLPRGIGFGPAEVDFLNVLSTVVPVPPPPATVFNDTTARNAYQALINGRYASNSAGDTGVPGAAGRDLLAALKHAGIPDNYSNTPLAQPNWYASPPDVWGRGALVMDYGGHPLMAFMGNPSEVTDSPYEISLSGQYTGVDSPYTPFEIERLLRYQDSDSQYLRCRPLDPSGLAAQVLGPTTEPAGYVGASHRRRQIVAGMTSYIPTPTTTIPQEMRTTVATGVGKSTILDLYRAKLAANSVADIDTEMRKIVPWEFFKGQKFDLNRWLGNGADDNGDNARDDPNEANTNEPAWSSSLPLPTGFPNVPAYRLNNSYFVTNNDARQLYARHLFCLAMLFMPPQFQPPNCPHEAGLNQVQYRRLIVRRVAQWAVNCVDFRDYDSIMTPFEFDYNPWDGWQVDGNLATDGNNQPENVPGLPAIQAIDRGLVWGMEYPDLLITETMAFHDRRVKDTKYDHTGKDRGASSSPDPTVDQFRVPQGSAFVELYCPRPTLWTAAGQQANQKPQLPGELYVSGQLWLGNGNGGSPIWRLAFSEVNPSDTNHPGKLWGTNHNWESTSFDPQNMTLIQGSATPMTIDRYAYFTTNANLPISSQNRSFYITNGDQPALFPGQYAVVGPRSKTYLGSNNITSPTRNPPTSAADPQWGGNSKQVIDLSAGVTVMDSSGNTTSRTTGIRPSLPIICDMSGVVPVGSNGNWNAMNKWNAPASKMTFGLNITEPLPVLGGNYYPEPIPATLPAGLIADFYDDPDSPTQATTADDGIRPEGEDQKNNRPLVKNSNMIPTRTYQDCAAVFLQRLANPNLPYNPPPFDAAGNGDPDYNANVQIINPYITVDWASIDVTVFTGEEDVTRTVSSGKIDLDDNYDPASTTANIFFRTRQRGFPQGNYYANGNVGGYANPWSPYVDQSDTIYTKTPLTSPVSGPYFNVDLKNDNATLPGPLYFVPDNVRHTLGWLNEPIDQLLSAQSNNNTQYSNYAGEPAHPFPWITWHNRPFANPMELLAVPSSSPSRIGSEITPGFTAISTTSGPYTDGNTDQFVFRSPFGHLLNFFQTEDAQNLTANAYAAHFYRILDYVEVPSPYSGAERWYSPATSTALNNFYPYCPPFNKLSRFRDPGRININTIFDEDIWIAACGQFPTMNTQVFAQTVFKSRNGSPSATNWYDMDQNYPTRFANPFRPADSADLMPNVPTTGVSMRKVRPIEATFMRPTPGTTAPNELPLFQPSLTDQQWAIQAGQPPTDPIGQYPGHFRDINRNPYFRYQGYQKIGNVFSTTSNCFAVWITIGYFEVDTITVDAAHPDGFQLGQEVGADTGEVSRHRAFYIIDRSVPVGFSPGSRLNTDDCILVRRMIE